MSDRDLVVLTVSGPQTFIEESRSTTDLRSASVIIATLAARAAQVLRDGPPSQSGPESDGTAPASALEAAGEVIFPGGSIPEPAAVAAGIADGIPNRISALVPAGQGTEWAKAAKSEALSFWVDCAARILGANAKQLLPADWPAVRWVSVPGSTGRSYREQWELAHGRLQERKRIGDFPQRDGSEPGELCMLSPRWRALSQPPKMAPKHMADVQLAPVNWVKRLWHLVQWNPNADSERFPSTNAISSAPYRNAALRIALGLEGSASDAEAVRKAVRDLEESISSLADSPNNHPEQGTEAPLRWLAEPARDDPDTSALNWFRARGIWVYPETWNIDALGREFLSPQQVAELRDDPGAPRPHEVEVHQGSAAAKEIATVLARCGAPPLSRYLAVLHLDLDSMGRFLSGTGTAQDGSALEISPEAHSATSGLLTELARKQKDAIREHNGLVVYAGGDDLLALLPASTALTAAIACRKAVADFTGSLPSASAGLMFFPHDSALATALQDSRALLDSAKANRASKDTIGIGYSRGSGTQASCAVGWESLPSMQSVAHAPARGQKLSPRIIQDLDALEPYVDHQRLGPDGDRRGGLGPEAARSEVTRLVRRHLNPTAGAAAGAPGSEEAASRAEARRITAALEELAPKGALFSSDTTRVAYFLQQESG